MKRLKTSSYAWLAGFGLTLVASAAAPPVATPLGAYRELLQSPARLAADGAGNVFVTEPASSRVVMFDAFGRPAVVKEGLAGPLAIAANRSGNIFLSEEDSGSVTVFDPQWNLLHKLGSGNGEFALPNYIALDPTPGSDAVYVSDSLSNQIKVFANQTLAFAFGSQGTNAGQFDFPTGVFVSTDSEVFVVDQNNSRIQVFDLQGGFLRQFTAVTTSGSSLGGAAGGRSQGITGDAAGRIYVADTLQGLVNVFNAQGTLLLKMSGFGEALGKSRSPSGLALDAHNRLLIASVNNSRLELFGLDSFFHFTAVPATQIVGAGTDVTFSVTAGGTGPFTFQWRKDTVDLSDAGKISGATNTTLSLTGVTPNDAGNYSVVIGGPAGSITSPAAPMTVLVPPSIVLPPASQIAAQGSTVNLNVTAGGDSPSYQWQFNGANITGATASTLQLTNVQPSHSGGYAVTVTNPVGAIVSTEATLTVMIPLSIAVPPSGWSVIQGTDLNFQVTAFGDSPAYQWRFNDVAIPGATTDTLALTSVQPADAGDYSVVITNLIGTVTSSPARLTVIISPTPPLIEGVVFQADGGIEFTMSGDSGYTYTIQGSTNLVDWTSLTNVVNVTGRIQVLVPGAAITPQQFFRLRWSR